MTDDTHGPTPERIGRLYDEVSDFLATRFGGVLHVGYWEDARDRSPVADATRRLTDMVVGRAALTDGDHLLDVGCGNGMPALHVAAAWGANVTGVSVSRHQIQVARRNAAAQDLSPVTRFEYADAAELPFPDEAFDAAIAIESMTHMPGPVRTLREVARVLRPGGRLVVADAMWSGPPEGRDTPFAHALCGALSIGSLPTAGDYRTWLERAGLELVGMEDIGDHVRRSFPMLGRGFDDRREDLARVLGAEAVDRAVRTLTRVEEVPDVGYALIVCARPWAGAR